MRPLTLAALLPGFDPALGVYLAVGLGVGAVVVASRTLSRVTGIPYPVFLVVAGAAAGFVPHVGEIQLAPRVVFLGFLPPLVYHAAIVTSPREIRANALSIGLGAVGLVLLTTFAVAALAFAVVPGLGWVGAFVLGAVVAPTDAVAATSIFARLNVPTHVATILEGESLVNDGVALALFTMGVAAVATPDSLGGDFLSFGKLAGGGIAFGLFVGWLAGHVRRPLRDPASQIVVSLLVPFAVYLSADALGISGVLATLATGLVLGQQPMSGLEPSGRIRMAEFWQVLVFLLESTLFVLVGLQLHRLVVAVGAYPLTDAVLLAVVSVVTVVAVRLIWWIALPTLRWRPEGRRLPDTGAVPWQERVALGWSGLRGAISLAAALSIPATVEGHTFPDRDLVVFATFCVIAATMVGQGTTTPWLLHRLGLTGNRAEAEQRALAERRCAEQALRMLDRLAAEELVSEDVGEWLRQRYERRLEHARADGESPLLPIPSLSEIEHRLLAAQHEVLRELHQRGEITFAVLRQVQHELDLEHARFEE